MGALLAGGPISSADKQALESLANIGQTWIIPERVADQVDNLRQVRQPDTIAGHILKAANSAWKRWTLISPLRAIKYNINNTSGDLDVVLAYNPKILKHAPQAARDLWRAHRDPGHVHPDIKAAQQGGVIGSSLTVQELPDLTRAPTFKYLTGESDSLWEVTGGRAMQGVADLTTLRENIMRLAAYRWFKQELGKGRKLYGASIAEQIDALDTVDEKATKLARELLGDYGALSVTGQKLRQGLAPFYSWIEINAPRYARMLRNIAAEARAEGAGTGRVGARLAGSVAVKTAGKGVAWSLRASILIALVTLWNKAVFPEEDDEMQRERRRLYLILGRTTDGRVRYMSVAGALADALSWFGMENPVGTAQRMSAGELTPTGLLKEAGQSFVGKVAGAVGPLFKTPTEVIFGRRLFPDPLKPLPIRDRKEYLANVWSLGPVYRKVTGMPIRPGAGNLMLDTFIATLDPGEAAYYAVKELEFDWLEAQGKMRGSSDPTARSNALYYYKLALRFGDEKAADKYWKRYKDLGGTRDASRQSIQRSRPGGAIAQQDQGKFKKSLTPEQKALWDKANTWYKRVYDASKEQRQKDKSADLHTTGSVGDSNRPNIAR